MKSKLSTKILGIVVTVATLSSLLVGLTAAPVSAAVATLGWGSVPAPSNANNVLGGTVYTGGSPPTGFAITGLPNVDFLEASPDGTTMFAWDNANAMLYTSTNGAASWTPRPWSGTNITALAGTVIKLLVSPNFATDNTIVLVTPTLIWISTNGGLNFSAAPAPDLETTGVITSADIGIAYNDGSTPSVIVGMTAGTTAGLFSNVEKFKLSGSYAWSQIGGLTTANSENFSVYGVAFSKNNALDAEILAVTNSVAAAGIGVPQLMSSYTNATFANGLPLAGAGSAPAGQTVRAIIAMGSDYNGYTAGNTLAIGLSGTTGGTSDNLYRVTGRSSANPGTSYNTLLTGGAVVVNDVSVVGTIATGTVLVGTNAGSTVYRNSTFPAGTSVTFSADTKAPTGAAVSGIVLAGTNAFAATTGVDGCVSVSANTGANWNGLSLCNVGAIKAGGTAGSIDGMALSNFYAADANNLFLIMTNSTSSGGGYANEQLWTSSNGGANWVRVATSKLLATAARIAFIAVSPAYATDKTFWVSQGLLGTMSTVYVTNDNGTTFTPIIASDTQSSIKAINGTTFYYGGGTAGATHFYKFGRWASGSFPAGITAAVSSIAFNPTDTTGATIAVGLVGGDVYLSTNDGVSFTKLAAGGATVAYGPDGSLYATDGSKILRYVAGTSSFLEIAAAMAPSTPNALVVTKDGTLYASDGTAANGVDRTLKPTSGSATSTGNFCEFQGLPGSSFTNSAGNTWGMSSLSVVNTATDNTLYVIAAKVPAAVAGTVSGTDSGYIESVRGFKDTFIVGPAITAPAAGAVLTTKTNAVLTWPAFAGVNLYQFQVYDNANFSGGLDYTGDGSTTAVNTTSNLTFNDKGNGTNNIASGSNYAWRLRASTVLNGAIVGNIYSRWSVVNSFSTAMLSPSDLNPIQAMTPVQGATGVDVNTTFSWPAVSGATYEFVIAEELGNADKFAIIDYSATTPTNATPLRETLKYNTQYWWRVRAVNGTTTSAWTVGFFTTEAAPVVTTAPTTTQAPPVQTIIVPTQTIPTPTVTVINSGNQNNTPVIPSALLWAIIAIGAVLIIAVIVLIVRTRKI